MENYSGRRQLGQFSPGTGQMITILADKIQCRFCIQLCAGICKVISQKGQRTLFERLDASTTTEDCAQEFLANTDPEISHIRKLDARDGSAVEKESEFKVDIRIEGIAQDVILQDEERMGKIQEEVEKWRKGSYPKSIREDLRKPENSMIFCEESSRIIHELGNIETVRIRTNVQHHPVPLLLQAHVGGLSRSCGLCLRFDEANVDSTLLFSRRNRSRGKKYGETQWQEDHWMPKEEQQDEKYRNSKLAHGWTEECCRYLDYLTTIDISYIATWEQRHRYESTITLACNFKDRQAGPVNARKDFKPTAQVLASLRQEQGRQNSQIRKNERTRQTPFDEELQAI